MRIFLGANVLFSASRAEGAMRHLLALCAEAGHELQADPYVIEEARRNLAAKAPAALPVLQAIAARIRVGAMLPGTQTAELAALPERTGQSSRRRFTTAARYWSPATANTSARFTARWFRE